MWHKAEWMGRPMRLDLTRVGLLVKLANRYTTRGAPAHFPVDHLAHPIVSSLVLFLLFCGKPGLYYYYYYYYHYTTCNLFTLFLTGSLFFFTWVWVIASLFSSSGQSYAARIIPILLLLLIPPRLFSKPLGTVPRVPTTSVTVTFMFNSFFISLSRFKYLSIISLSFIVTLWSAEATKSPR